MFLAIQYPSWIHPEIFPGVPFLHFIRWYGLMYLFAFGTAYFVCRKLARAGFLDAPGYTASDDDIISFFTWGIIFLLIGARVFSALIYDSTGLYLKKPWLIFWPFSDDGQFSGLAGMSYHGGFIGGTVGMVLWCVCKKKPLFQWVDAMAISIPAGYTWGRLGNFFNAELWGRVTTSPWGMIFPNAQRFSYSIPWVKDVADNAGIGIPAAGAGLVNLPRHPSQLYEALFEGIVLFLTLMLLWKRAQRKGKPFHGYFACVYTAGYGLVRFFIEYFREPDTYIGYRIAQSANEPTYLNVSWRNISTGQILCLLMIAAAVIAFFALKMKAKKKPAAG